MRRRGQHDQQPGLDERRRAACQTNRLDQVPASPCLVGRTWPSLRLGLDDDTELDTNLHWVVCLLGPIEPGKPKDPEAQRILEWARFEPVLRTVDYQLLAVSSEPVDAAYGWMTLNLGLQWALWSDPQLHLAHSLQLPVTGHGRESSYVPATLIVEQRRITKVFWRVDATDAETLAKWVIPRAAAHASAAARRCHDQQPWKCVDRDRGAPQGARFGPGRSDR
jgi:hypothetical protein